MDAKTAHPSTSWSRKLVKRCLVSIAASKPKQPIIVLDNHHKLTIGRSETADIVLHNDVISREHATLVKDVQGRNAWSIMDNESLNGVKVNKHQIPSNKLVSLKEGDEIQFGEASTKHSEPPFIYKFCCNRTVRTVKRRRDDQGGIESSNKYKKVSKTESASTSSNTACDGDAQTMDPVESEFACSICSELFVKAVLLNCSHTFCEYCINQWRLKKPICPICRAPITNQTASLAVDNFIDRLLKSDPKSLERRTTLLKERSCTKLMNDAWPNCKDGVE